MYEAKWAQHVNEVPGLLRFIIAFSTAIRVRKGHEDGAMHNKESTQKTTWFCFVQPCKNGKPR